MFTKQLALISETAEVPFSEVAIISAALQKQITRDFAPIWNSVATIDAFSALNDMPIGYWPIIIRDDIGFAGAAGIHLDSNNQPYALVQASSNTPLTCSHECLEMLADPFGNRLMPSDSIKHGQGRVSYLVEVCDPSEAKQFGYSVNGMILSDFYTPSFFNPVACSGVQYSFTGAIKKPKQILPDGYISWMVPETQEWWQAFNFDGSLEFKKLGILKNKNSRSWRETIDSLSFESMLPLISEKIVPVIENAGLFASAAITEASTGRGNQLSRDIQNLLASISHS